MMAASSKMGIDRRTILATGAMGGAATGLGGIGEVFA
jgi:TAT (twin-arginine translocation) pathway signal sequence